MSCSNGMTFEAYCAQNPATYGCPHAGTQMSDMNGGMNGGMYNDKYSRDTQPSFGGNSQSQYPDQNYGGRPANRPGRYPKQPSDPYAYNGGMNNHDMMAGGWSKSSMSGAEMERKWDEVLAKKSNSDLVTQENLAQLDEPTNVETQVVRGTNYKFTFEDGTVVTVLEVSWENTLDITDIKRGSVSQSHMKLQNIHQSLEQSVPHHVFTYETLIAAALGGSIAGVIFGLVYSGFRDSRKEVNDDMYIDLTLDAQQKGV